ncbi:hypothetical protein GCK32_019987, partial [Trichostrongylus colubriformis]
MIKTTPPPPPPPAATTLFPDWGASLGGLQTVRPLNIKPINPIRRAVQSGLPTFPSEKTLVP